MGEKFVWLVRSDSGLFVGRGSSAQRKGISDVLPFASRGVASAAMNWAKLGTPSERWRIVKYKLVEVEE